MSILHAVPMIPIIPRHNVLSQPTNKGWTRIVLSQPTNKGWTRIGGHVNCSLFIASPGTLIDKTNGVSTLEYHNYVE